MHHRVAVRSASSQYDDMCIQSSGFDGIRITNNTMIDCVEGFIQVYSELQEVDIQIKAV